MSGGTRERPAADAERSQKIQGVRIGPNRTTGRQLGADNSYAPQVAHRYWATTRRHNRTALRHDLRLLDFPEAVALGLVDGDHLAFPVSPLEVVA